MSAETIDAPVTTPSVRKAYYVGAISDPAHPELLYRPGVVFREESPERWNRNAGGLRGALTGPLSAVPDPALLPPASPEQQQLLVQQQEALRLLAETNEDLLHRESKVEPPPAPVVKPREPPRDAGSAGAVPTASSAGPDVSRALVANADGIIELAAEILDAVDRAEPNPFVKRYQPATAMRQIVAQVTGISLGPRPTAILNGRLLNVGDVWEGFVVAVILRDAVYLQRERLLLQIGAGRPVTLKLPP